MNAQTTMSERTRNNARKTADLIIEGGWCQGRRSLGTAMCAKEAMERVCVREHPTLGRMTEGLEELVVAFSDRTNGGYVIEFNDTPGRTKEEVLAVFEDIAKAY